MHTVDCFVKLQIELPVLFSWAAESQLLLLSAQNSNWFYPASLKYQDQAHFVFLFISFIVYLNCSIVRLNICYRIQSRVKKKYINENIWRLNLYSQRRYLLLHFIP